MASKKGMKKLVKTYLLNEVYPCHRIMITRSGTHDSWLGSKTKWSNSNMPPACRIMIILNCWRGNAGILIEELQQQKHWIMILQQCVLELTKAHRYWEYPFLNFVHNASLNKETITYHQMNLRRGSLCFGLEHPHYVFFQIKETQDQESRTETPILPFNNVSWIYHLSIFLADFQSTLRCENIQSSQGCLQFLTCTTYIILLLKLCPNFCERRIRYCFIGTPRLWNWPRAGTWAHLPSVSIVKACLV